MKKFLVLVFWGCPTRPVAHSVPLELSLSNFEVTFVAATLILLISTYVPSDQGTSR